jgi:hypothetical protein
VGELIERALSRLLVAIPAQMSGHEWSIAVGTLMDKWLLVQGQATARRESVSRLLSGLSDDEYRAVIAEAERIIESARRDNERAD